MKIALVDDEPSFLDEIDLLCRRFGRDTGYPVEVFPFGSAEAFLASFDSQGFDLVFMDIFMKGMSGVAAAAQLRRNDSACLLVFLTSSTDFMPAAFSCHAFEYIVKPFSEERFFDVLADAVRVLPQQRKYIHLASDRKNIPVFLDEIASAVSDAHYLTICLTCGEALRCRMTMPEFMEKTGRDPRFIPINKGITVNAEYILSFEKGLCLMESGAQFPVRVRDCAKVQQLARDYHFEKIRRAQAHSAKGSVPAGSSGHSSGEGVR